MTGLRPSTVIREIVNGDRSEWPAWANAGLSMATYQHARHVLSQPTRESRWAALERVPEAIRKDVETEAKRLWSARTKS